MSTVQKEGRFPLLFVVNMGTDPSEKPPFDPPYSTRDRNVTRGAASLISRWPHHIQTTSRLAFFTAISMMCMSFFIVAAIFYTSDIDFGKFMEHPTKHLAMCNIEKNHMYENIHEGADVDALVKFMSPFERAWEFFGDDEKIFFVMTQGDVLTPEMKCSIESAVHVNDNSSVFLLVLLDKPQDLPGSPKQKILLLAESEAAFNQSVKIVYVDVVKYLENTPLSGFWRIAGANKNLREMAAKLVTLWRFGGLSLDVNILSLKEAKLHRRNSKKAVVNMDGHVMSVRYPCHAFLFQAMKVLVKLQHGEQVMRNHLGISANDTRMYYDAGVVLTVTREVFCGGPHCLKRSGRCPGFKSFLKHVVCSLDDQPEDKSCVWASFTKNDTGTKFFNDVCTVISN